MVKLVFSHFLAPALWILKKDFFFDMWNCSGTLEYLRDAVEISPVSSSVQMLFKK